MLSFGKEMLNRLLDDMDVVSTDREKYSWALGLIESYINDIWELPSAQPERPKGKWIPHREKSREYIGTVLVNVEYDYWFCDTCGYRVKNGQPIHNFCPHCGADMRGERDE